MLSKLYISVWNELLLILIATAAAVVVQTCFSDAEVEPIVLLTLTLV